MKKLPVLFLLISFFLLAQGPAFGQPSKDTAEVKMAVENIVIYFYTGDMDSFGNLFDPNAAFITVTGVVAKGKDQIVDMHKSWKIDTATIVKFKDPVVNFINRDIAISYLALGGLVFGEGSGTAQGIVQSGYLTVVLQRMQNTWKILSATNAYNFTGKKDFDLTTYKSKNR